MVSSPGLDIIVCPIPVKTNVGQVDFVLSISYGCPAGQAEFLKFVGPIGQKIIMSANNVNNAGPHVR
jgi:hypothetical protein